MSFFEGTPGRRFMARYRHRRRKRSAFAHGVAMAGGALLMVAGVLLLMTPGPGSLILLAGATLLARESRRAAQLLDQGELRMRAIFRRARGAPAPARCARPARRRSP